MNLIFKMKNIIILLMTLILLNNNYAAEDNLEIISPTYFAQEKNIYDDINYLENEFLSFEFCSNKESKDINFEIICKDGFKMSLDVFKYINEKKTSLDTLCHYTNYDLKDLDCSDFSLEINYNNNNKQKQIKRNFKKQKESKLINNVLNKKIDSISDPLELSYFLIVHNDVENINSKRSIEAYEKLKNMRNNLNKCWPSSSCNLLITSKILNNLKIAGYKLDSRLLEDGKIYLDKNILSDEDINYPKISSQSEIYEFNIHLENNFTSNIDCELNIDDESTKLYTFDSADDYFDLIINSNLETNLEFSCDESIDKIIFKNFEEKIESRKYSNDNRFIYTLSESNKDDFSSFNLELKIEHNFAINESISCDIIIDDNKKTYTFDKNSDSEDLLFEDEFEDEFEIDCFSDTLDDIYFEVYGGDLDIEENINTNSFEYEMPGKSSGLNSYNFQINFKYDFINSNDKISCELSIDDGTPKKYTFDDSNNLIIDSKSAENKIFFDCNKELKEIELEIFDKYNRVQINEINLDSKSISYGILSDFSKYSCLGINEDCNYESSLNSLIIYTTNLDDYTNIEKYINSLIQKKNDEISIDSKYKNLNSGKYLYYKQNTDLINYLKFKQNNDGSWGTNSDNEKITESSWAVLGLQKNNLNSEYVDDGKKWIYFNEPLNSWGDIEKNSLAYLAIKEQIKPYLKINTINKISKEVIIKISNPTIHNLKDVRVEFDEEINDYLSYFASLGDLDGNANLSLKINLQDDFLGILTGEMKIIAVNGKNEELELVTMPVSIIGDDAFYLDLKLNYTLSKGKKEIKIDLIKINSEIISDCNYINPFTGLKTPYTITKNVNTLNIINPELKTGNFKSELICNINDNEFIIPFEFDINIAEETFEIIEINVDIKTLDDFSINLNSTLNVKQTISFEIDGDYTGIIEASEKHKIIAGKDYREIFFTIKAPQKLLILQNTSNLTRGDIIISSSSGFTKRIPIDLNLSNEKETSIPTLYIVIAIITLIVIFIIIIRFIRQKKYEKEQALNHLENNDEDELLLDDHLEFK